MLKEGGISYEEAMNNDTYKPIVEKELIARIGFVIEPQYLFSNLINEIEKQTFQIEDLSNAVKMLKTLREAMKVKMTLSTF